MSALNCEWRRFRLCSFEKARWRRITLGTCIIAISLTAVLRGVAQNAAASENNACSETMFASLKLERLLGHRFETISWLLWYNRERLHSTLNYVSPMQFEQAWTDATMKIAA